MDLIGPVVRQLLQLRELVIAEKQNEKRYHSTFSAPLFSCGRFSFSFASVCRVSFFVLLTGANSLLRRFATLATRIDSLLNPLNRLSFFCMILSC